MKFAACLVLMAMLGMNGCFHDRSGQSDAVNFGRLKVDYVRQFDCQFGKENCRHWISYYDGHGGKPHWNSFTKLHGRYTLTMQFDIAVDRWHDHVEPIGDPEFYLLEVMEVDAPNHSPAGVGVKYGENYRFQIEEWIALLDAKGDFSEIGIDLEKDSRIPGIEFVTQ